MNNVPEKIRHWAETYHVMEAYQLTYVPSFDRTFEILLWRGWNGDLGCRMELHPLRVFARPGAERRTPVKVQVSLDPIAWQTVLDAIAHHGFWDDDWPEHAGFDGASWYFSGLQKGKYKLREIWSPDPGEPAYDLGWAFFNLVPSTFCPVLTATQADEAYRNRSMTPESPMIVVY